MTVVLIACESGGTPDGYAQQLSIFLGANVIAPDKPIWIYSNGNVEIAGKNPPPPGEENGSIDRSDPGRFVLFTPN